MRTEITLIRLNSHLNIMERELIDFSETWDAYTTPQRLDDLRALLVSMRAITTDIMEGAYE